MPPMIEHAYPYLLLSGATILVVMGILWRQARRAGRLNLALIRFNEQCGFDTPAFLAQAWTLLAPSGLLGLSWRLDWFGVVSDRRFGAADGRQTARTITVGEMAIALTFYQQEGRGERRYFEETLIETFMLLLRTDMLIKAGTTDAALSHMSKLNLFLQHDMKNIAQFVQLMGDQLDAVPAGKEQKVLDYLRRATPLIRHRADRIVRTLTIGLTPLAEQRVLDLRAYLAELCGVYALAHSISGDARIETRDNTLDTVFDNILKNYFDLAIRDNLGALRLRIAIGTVEGRADVTIDAPGAPLAPELGRLFEPFWSSDPAGLGIGLYQAKQLIEMHGGALFVTEPDDAPLRFHVRYPLLSGA